MKHYYPIFLDLDSQPCLIVGGGEVAEQKIEPLLDCGARVTVISPDLTSQLRESAEAGTFRWIPRQYEPGDVEGYFLVVCATDAPAVNEQVAADGLARNLLVNVVDAPRLCRFIMPAVVRRGDLCIAISTGGTSPAMAQRIRQQLEHRFGPEYAILLDILGSYRAEMKERYPDDFEQRQALWENLVHADLLDLIRGGQIDEARQKVEACISTSSA
ncbi:MAG: bifunctional precorrin-2 dehydrogenase/sirohydrochlorin ferrochelatase [Candidatus Latescibacteria bacterium]|nr:bifunctional precorrin-2 dehydrogenase/sirohydrochlorin ferrochelatase [Candidatus Latescibacterota bacterium]